MDYSNIHLMDVYTDEAVHALTMSTEGEDVYGLSDAALPKMSVRRSGWEPDTILRHWETA